MGLPLRIPLLFVGHDVRSAGSRVFRFGFPCRLQGTTSGVRAHGPSASAFLRFVGDAPSSVSTACPP